MKDSELAQILHDMYEHANRNEAVCQIHLFGIQYAKELKECKIPLKEILAQSGLSQGYLPEISKGMKLAKYVQVKQLDGDQFTVGGKKKEEEK